MKIMQKTFFLSLFLFLSLQAADELFVPREPIDATMDQNVLSLEDAVAKNDQNRIELFSERASILSHLAYYYAARNDCCKSIPVLRKRGIVANSENFYNMTVGALEDDNKDRAVATLKTLFKYRPLIVQEDQKDTFFGWKPLHFVVRKYAHNTVPMLERLHAAGQLLDEKVHHLNTRTGGMAALHIAACAGCLPVVDYLIKNGVNVNGQTMRGETPLILCLKGLSIKDDIVTQESKDLALKIMTALLAHEADPNRANEEKCFPIHYAAFFGTSDMVKLLTRYGASLDCLVDNPSSECYLWNELHCAAYEGNADVLKYVLEESGQHYNVNVQNGKKNSPLHLVFYKKYKDEDVLGLVKILMHHGADPNLSGHRGATPLMLAAHQGYPQCIKYMIEHGADAHKNTDDGLNLLSYAIMSKNAQAIAYILSLHDLDLNSSGRDGQTAFLAACYFALSPELMQELKDAGGDVSVKTVTGHESGFHLLAMSKSKQAVQLVPKLLEFGLDIDACNVVKQTPLHLACIYGKDDMVKALLEHGAKVDIKDENNRTPLFYAAQANHPHIIALLREKNADKSIKDKHDMTAYEIAEEMGHTRCVQLLEASKKAKNVKKKKARQAQQREQDRIQLEKKRQQHEARKCTEVPSLSQATYSVIAQSNRGESSALTGSSIDAKDMMYDFPRYAVFRQREGDMTIVIYKQEQMNDFDGIIRLDKEYAKRADKFHRFSTKVDGFLSYGIKIDESNKHQYEQLMQDYHIRFNHQKEYAIVLPGRIEPYMYNHRDALDDRAKIRCYSHSGMFVYMFNQQGDCFHRCFHQDIASKSVNQTAFGLMV